MIIKVMNRQSIELTMLALLALVPAAVLFPGVTHASPSRIHKTNAAFHIESRLRISLEEVASIGTLDDDLLFMWAGIAADSDGFVYVTDAMDYALKKFDPSGRLVKRTGRKGQGPGEFTAPRFLAASGSYLFVTDQSIPGIQVFDKALNYVSRIPFSRPISDLAAISNDTLAIIPMSMGGSGDVIIIDFDGNVEKEFQYAEPENKLTLFNVADVEIDGRRGDILLAFSFRDRVEKWSPEGHRIWSKELLGSGEVTEKKVAQFTIPSELLFKTITVDSQGKIYVLSGNLTDHPSRDVFVLDPEGSHLTTFTLPEPSHCIFIDSRDYLYSRANEGVTIKKYRMIFEGN